MTQLLCFALHIQNKHIKRHPLRKPDDNLKTFDITVLLREGSRHLFRRKKLLSSEKKYLFIFLVYLNRKAV